MEDRRRSLELMVTDPALDFKSLNPANTRSTTVLYIQVWLCCKQEGHRNRAESGSILRLCSHQKES